MSDPRQVLAAGTDIQRDLVRRVWPELWSALGGDAPAGQPAARRLRCPLCAPAHDRIATRRITRNGTPACDTCLKHLDVIGHPLERTTER